MRTRTVEVFKTSVDSRDAADQIITYLSSIFEGAQITFDLEDIDSILRIATSEGIHIGLVVAIVGLFGHHAEVLEDTVAETSAN